MNSLTTTCCSFVGRSFQNRDLNRKNLSFKTFVFKNFSHNSFYFWSSYVLHYCSLCYVPWQHFFSMNCFWYWHKKMFLKINPLLSKMLYRNICNIPSNSKPSVSCRNKFIYKPVFDISNFVTSYWTWGRQNRPCSCYFIN